MIRARLYHYIGGRGATLVVKLTFRIPQWIARVLP